MSLTPVFLDTIRSLKKARELVLKIDREETQFAAETVLEVKSGFKSPSPDLHGLRRSLMTDYMTLITDHQTRLSKYFPLGLIVEPEETKKQLTSEELYMTAQYLSTVSRAVIYLRQYPELNLSFIEKRLHNYSVTANKLSQMAHDKQAI